MYRNYKLALVLGIAMIVLLTLQLTTRAYIGYGDTDITLTVEGTGSGGTGDNTGGTGGGTGETGNDTGGGTGDNTGGGTSGSGGTTSGGTGDTSSGPEDDLERPGVAAGGTDESGNKYYLRRGIKVSDYVKNNGYIVGYGNFVYGPTDYLTRAQFATIMARVFDFGETKITKTFEDTKGHWAEEAILVLANNGVIKGVDEENFNPEGTLNRDHVLLMLSRVMYTDKFSTKSTVTSVNTHYSKTMMARMINSGLYHKLDDNFELRQPITREEMVYLINNLIYARDKSISSTEYYINKHGLYEDLSKATSIYYKDCVKALDIKWVKEQMGTLIKIEG